VRSSSKLIQVSVTSVIDHQCISVHVLVHALTGMASPLIPTLPYWRFGTSHIYSSAYIHEWNTSNFPLICVYNHHNLSGYGPCCAQITTSIPNIFSLLAYMSLSPFHTHHPPFFTNRHDHYHRHRDYPAWNYDWEQYICSRIHYAELPARLACSNANALHYHMHSCC